MNSFFTKVCKAFAVLFCAAAIATPSMAAEYKQEYKLSCVPGPTSGWTQGAFYFADLVRERTNGRVNIKVYPAGQLFAGKQTNEFMMLRQGAIDFAFGSTINWSPQVKELNLTCLPFFVGVQPKPYKAMDAILDGKAGKMMIAAVEKKGVHVIGWAENGFRELKGMKIRVVGSPLFIETFRALGANPVNMNWSEAITGFQQGIVDGQENPTTGILIPTKIWLYHKYMCNWHYLIDPLLISVNPADWKQFSAEDQKIITECAADAGKYSKALSRCGLDDGTAMAFLKSINKLPSDADPIELMKKNGMTVVNLTPEQEKAFSDSTKSVRDNWTKKIGPELVKAAEEDMASVK